MWLIFNSFYWVEKDKSITHYSKIIDNTHILMIKLFHHSLDFGFTVYVNAVLLFWFVDSKGEDDKRRWLLFTPLIEKAYLKRWWLLKYLVGKSVAVFSCEWVFFIDSSHDISFFHKYLYAEEKSCPIRFEVKVISTMQCLKLLYLILFTVNTSDHICSLWLLSLWLHTKWIV